MSRPKEPEGMVSISTAFWFLPRRMIEPLPKALSICASAASSALVLSTEVPSTRRRLACVTAVFLLHGRRQNRNSGRRRAVVHGLFSYASSFFVANIYLTDDMTRARVIMDDHNL